MELIFLGILLHGVIMTLGIGWFAHYFKNKNK